MPQFYTLLTDVGQAKLANAVALGTTIEITQLAVGDGGGDLPTPDSSATALVNEVRRAAINASQTDPDNPSWIVVEQVLPPDVGGWTIREIGIFDVDGDLIGIGNYPETYKPVLSEGSSRTQTVRFVLEVSDTSAVILKVDPSVVLATREYVDDSLAEYGIGAVYPGGPLLEDFANAAYPSGLYRAWGAGTPTPTPNGPPGSGNSRLSVYAINVGGSVHWIVAENSASASSAHRLFFGNTHNGGVVWNQAFHDGLKSSNDQALGGADDTTVMTPMRTHEAFKQFGLGVAPIIDGFDFSQTRQDGLQAALVSNAVNGPPGAGLTGMVLFLGAEGATHAGTLYFDYHNDAIHYRRRDSESWVVLYHSGNDGALVKNDAQNVFSQLDFVMADDARRVLIGGGSAHNITNGGYIVMEGRNYGGPDAGGDVDLRPGANPGAKASVNGWKIWDDKDAAKSLATNGYAKLPNGLILQWGQVAVTGQTTVNFPIEFPNACFGVAPTKTSSPSGDVEYAQFPTFTKGGCEVVPYTKINIDKTTGSLTVGFLAIGH